MTFISDLTVPLLAVERPAKGRLLTMWPRHGYGLPLTITVTAQELHLSLAEADGPALVVDLDHILNPAIHEFEQLMGFQRSRR